jgi:hypothetical protein
VFLRRVLGLVAVIVMAVSSASCAALGRSIADFQYGHLELPIDREAATTVASFPPSADIRAVVGGKGEGLDCSIPWLLQKLMFSPLADADSAVSLQFRQSCVTHDYCYRHGAATYGYSQADCDFNLLEHAFRTCIQIYDLGWILFPHSYAGDKTIEICRSRAREVLLGVRIGGQSSFKPREESSYFEFDPMPIRAEDYTVARLSRLGANASPILVDGAPLVSTPTTFHIDRGRIKARELRWGDDEMRPLGYGDVEISTVFPDVALPTPPAVARVGDNDWYIWLTRGKPFTSGFNAMVIDSTMNGKGGSFRLLPCPQAPPSARAPKPTPKCDFDASVVRLIQPTDIANGEVGFFAFTHRFADKTDGRNRLEADTIGIHAWSVPWTTLRGTAADSFPTPVPSKVKHVSSHHYRFLQSELHVGEFRRRGCAEVLAFGRGIYVDADQKPEEAKADEAKTAKAVHWQDRTLAALMPLRKDECPKAAVYPLALPQDTEPAVPVSRGPSVADRLLTIRTGDEGLPVRFTEYQFTEAQVTKADVIPTVKARDERGMEIPLDRTWIKNAAYVVRGAAGDRIFFSRVFLNPEQAQRFATGQAPDALFLQFRYFQASTTGWVEQGYSSCEVDLDRQHGIVPHQSTIRGLNRRLAFEGVKTRYWDDEWQAYELFRRLHKRELLRRWMQSQVIPGFIFRTAAPDRDRPIDATVIFHGSADYSLLLQGVAHANSPRLNGLELRRPAGRFVFARCSGPA